MTNIITRLKAHLGVLAIGLTLSLVLGFAVVHSYSNSNPAPQNLTESGNIIVTNNYLSGQESGQMIGAISGSSLVPNHLDAGEWTQWNDGQFDDVEIEDDTWIAGDLSVTGTVSLLGDTRLKTPVRSGSIATFTVTSTATAANVCDSPLWQVTPVTTTPTITLPSTSTLFADCLTTNGDQVQFSVAAITTSSIIAIGTGGNMDLGTTATITADKSARIILTRDSATTYLVQLANFNN